MTDHTIEKTDTGYHCPVCLETWKREPQGYARIGCPGMPYYKKWELVPEHLKTQTQLRKLRLRPTGEVKARIYWHDGYYDLYDQAETKPMREASEKQKEALAKGRELTGTRVCPRCGEREDNRAFTKQGICWACHEKIETAQLNRMIREARRDAIAWARGVLANPDQYIILDTETTGLDSKAEVVQVGIIDLEGNVLVNRLVKPIRVIPAEAMAIHGITLRRVMDACSFPQLMPILERVWQGKTVITYNADYDSRVIRQSAWAWMEPIVLDASRWACAMEMYAQYYGEWNDYHRSFKWQKLYGGDHSAVGDCWATLDLIRSMADDTSLD